SRTLRYIVEGIGASDMDRWAEGGGVVFGYGRGDGEVPDFADAGEDGLGGRTGGQSEVEPRDHEGDRGGAGGAATGGREGERVRGAEERRGGKEWREGGGGGGSGDERRSRRE